MSSIHLSKGFANIFLNFCNRWRQNSKSLKHFLPVCWFMFKAINRVPWTKSIDVILTSLVMTFNRHFPLGYMEKHVQNYEKNARKRELNVIFTLSTEFQILWCTFHNKFDFIAEIFHEILRTFSEHLYYWVIDPFPDTATSETFLFNFSLVQRRKPLLIFLQPEAATGVVL